MAPKRVNNKAKGKQSKTKIVKPKRSIGRNPDESEDEIENEKKDTQELNSVQKANDDEKTKDNTEEGEEITNQKESEDNEKIDDNQEEKDERIEEKDEHIEEKDENIEEKDEHIEVKNNEKKNEETEDPEKAAKKKILPKNLMGQASSRKTNYRPIEKSAYITFYAIDIVFKAFNISPNSISTEKLIELLNIEKFEWENDGQELIDYIVKCFEKFNIKISDDTNKSPFVITKVEQENFKRIVSFIKIDDYHFINYFQNCVWNLLIIKDGKILYKIDELSYESIKGKAINIYIKK